MEHPNKPVTGVAKRLWSYRRPGIATLITFVFALLPHTVLLAFGLRHLDSSFDLPADVVNLRRWVSAVARIAGVLVLPAANLFGLFRAVEPSVLVLPVLFGMANTGFRREGQWVMEYVTFVDASFIFFFFSCISYLLAYIFYVSASLLRPRGVDQANAETEQEQPFVRSELATSTSEETTLPPTKQYADFGCQTSERTTESAATASGSTPACAGSSPSASYSPKTVKLQTSQQEKNDIGPLELVAFTWAAALLPSLGKEEDSISRRKHRGTQTETTTPTRITASTGSALSGVLYEEPSKPAKAALPPKVVSLIEALASFYLEVYFLRQKAKPADPEAPPTQPDLIVTWRRKNPRPLWLAVLVYPVWFVTGWVGSLFQLYPLGTKAVIGLLDLHEGDVMWIAFAITNTAAAAVYYLALFDGKGTFSPAWVAFLG